MGQDPQETDFDEISDQFSLRNSDYERSELDDGKYCPTCGYQIRRSVGPTRGSAAEMLAEERAEAHREEAKDTYRALLHLFVCNLLTKDDIEQYILWARVTNNLEERIRQAYENAEETEDGAILKCPACDRKIKSWARWFDPEHTNSVTPNRTIR